MAVAMSRVTLSRLGVKTILGKTSQPLIAARVTPVIQTQVAHLRATYGEKYPYSKPYAYETKSYNFITEWIDGTAHRLNENSKIIVVEGNVAVGKNEFAKRLADMFDMKFMPALDESSPFIRIDNGFDMRTLNPLLPKELQFYDVATWLNDPNPDPKIGMFEVDWYREKVTAYCRAMLHVLSTGQGVVIANSAFGHTGFVEAMRRHNYITRNFMKFFCTVRDDTLVEMFRPHIMVYLHAPVSVIRDRIRKRNNPAEVNSRVLTDEFLAEVDRSFKEACLPMIRKTTEVMEVDWSKVVDDLDMEALAEEMTQLNLESNDREDPKFGDWYGVSEDELALRRKQLPTEWYIPSIFKHQVPSNCSEILHPPEADQIVLERIISDHPAIKYEPGWAPEFGHKTLLRF